MKNNYSFFEDAAALAEIRKHKWIESQKAKKEIGFCEAALDWINKYGRQWKRVFAKHPYGENFLIERRKFRRFELNATIELVKNNICSMAQAVDISFLGILCRSQEYLHIGAQIGVHIGFGQSSHNDIIYSGIVERISPIDSRKYELFLRFEECSQRELEKLYFSPLFSPPGGS